ncbi:MAG: GspH/FimT family pseudopilin [Gammaproteobacteria bacterium]|jgi:type IV fimbrial biogenesis protein FimT
MRKYYFAFTLLELLIVLTIIAIISCVAFPAYQTLVARMHAKIEIFRLYRAIQLTRSEAIKNNAIATICPGNDHLHCGGNWQDGYLVFIDNRGDGKVDPEDKLVKYFPAMHDGGVIEWNSFPKRHYLQMAPSGFTNNQNGTFYYTAAKGGYKISLIVSKVGRIRVTS